MVYIIKPRRVKVMLGKMAFLISVSGFTMFVIFGLSNFIMGGFYGLSESKYKLMLSLAVAAISFGVFLILTSPGTSN